MSEKIKQASLPRPGEHLKLVAALASFGGFVFSMLGTGLIWAGGDTFNYAYPLWKISLEVNLSLSFSAWFVYLPFRNTDKLLGNGLLALFMLFSLFWVFGFAGFYFYFLFAPISVWPRAIAISIFTAILLYRANIIARDINDAFRNHHNLFERMYQDEGSVYTFTRDAVGLLEKARRDRNPFRSIHAYAATAVAPFVLALNRILTPTFGDGHGVFIVLAFFSVPLLLWGTGVLVQTIVTMIYYPIKLQRETGKPVLMKNW